MIVLDTNVVSEVMRPDPDRAVVNWLDKQPASLIWTTTITVYEIEFGLQRLPDGKRRRTLEQLFREVIDHELEARILPLDTPAALTAGALSAKLQAAGNTVDVRDVLIAGIAQTHQATVATRNVKDFDGACNVMDPWTAR